jgi:hypothetical protein
MYGESLLWVAEWLRGLGAKSLTMAEFTPCAFRIYRYSDYTLTVKMPHEHDSIGIIICKEKNRTIVEYSLKSSVMPIGVATTHHFLRIDTKFRRLYAFAMNKRDAFGQKVRAIRE